MAFELSIEEFKKLIFDKCYYCGTEPESSTFTSSQKTRRDIQLSYNGIDRVNNFLNYIASNCVSCCIICNKAKSNLSLEDFQKWIDRLVRFNNEKK